jgi:hypothetical protein
LTLKDVTVRGYCGLAPPPTMPFNSGNVENIIETSDNLSISDDIERTNGATENKPRSDKIVETSESKPKSEVVGKNIENPVNPQS